MKLLPRITSFVKDAAKAVKRISLSEFKEVADETLTELLGIATMVVKVLTKLFDLLLVLDSRLCIRLQGFSV